MSPWRAEMALTPAVVCRQWGGKLKVIANVSDEISVKRILTGLGLSPPEEDKPPAIRELVRVPLDDGGREIQLTTAPPTLTPTPQRG